MMTMRELEERLLARGMYLTLAFFEGRYTFEVRLRQTTAPANAFEAESLEGAFEALVEWVEARP